jgi:L-rhamnose-H+ transport protein
VTPQVLGLAIVCLSGVSGGCFAFPLRTRKLYAEENTLLGAYALATLAIPVAAASVLFPFWPRIFAGARPGEILAPVLCGMGWGIGAIAYARGVARIGIALTVSIVMSLTMAIGAVVPLAARWSAAGSGVRSSILAGVAGCVAGVLLVGLGGRLRERREARTGRYFVAGFLWCGLSGLLSPLANIGFDAGAPFVSRAAALGGDERLSALFGWFPTWWGGLFVLTAVLAARMIRSGTWRLYGKRGSGGDLLRTVVMGILHFLGQVPYGIGAVLLGAFGTSIGWAATLAAQLVTANALGLLMGEWKGAPVPSRVAAVLGVLAIAAAVAVLASASLSGPARG